MTFRLSSDRIASNCAEAVLNAPHDGSVEVEIREHVRLRTTGQNSRYWATLTECLRQIGQDITEMAEHTGYSPLEIRRLVAATLEPEMVALLYTHTPEAAHDILKLIHGIKTSTRLGTKKFMEFEERMTQTITNVVGEVRNFARMVA